MVEEGNFHEEFRKCTCLDIVIVGLGDSSDPRVRGAIGRDFKVESLENDPFTLEDLFLVVALLSHKDKLVDTGISSGRRSIRRHTLGRGSLRTWRR